jgi:hypothetical protein
MRELQPFTKIRNWASNKEPNHYSSWSAKCCLRAGVRKQRAYRRVNHFRATSSAESEPCVLPKAVCG